MSDEHTVLLIEDSDTQALLFTDLLERAGMSVYRVPTAEDGLKHLQSNRPDLIVVDYHLPGLQGDDFCRLMRANASTDTIPLLILTDDSQSEAEQHGLNCGADDYVAKSDDPELLLARVDLLMRRSRAQARADRRAASFFRAQRILVTDDSPTFLAFLEGELRHEGYSVATAESGEAALEALKEDDFDCAVIDLVMPGMDGIALCRALCELRSTNETALPILIVTSSGSKEKMMEALDVGADDFVDKANDTTVLKARIRSLLRRKTLQDERQRAQKQLILKELEIVRELTGGIAHDFNNLLAVIIGNSEVLCDEVGDPDLKEIAELIMTAAEQGASLTERLLAFGRRQALSPETLDLGEVIGGLLDKLKSTLGDEIALETRADAGRPACLDRSLLESALHNLAHNARDAMPDGGSLTISTNVIHAANGFAGALPPGDYIRLRVTDTGVGMPRDVLERAFAPFFTTKDMGKGSGLGLSMVYGFAKQSGGHVTIESQVGQGTSVSLFLPVAQAQATAAPVRASMEAQPMTAGSETILLVEDEPQLRRSVRRQLDGLGYQVLEADAGEAALDILRSNPEVDLLFTDLVMPGGMSGFDLVRHARALIPGLKVLLTTGYAAETDETITNIREPILKKPYKKEKLTRALREALKTAA